jgi:O-antigen ligase
LFICLPLKKSGVGALLLFALAGFLFALLLTVTRASWLAFLVSATAMLVLGTSRRSMMIGVACALPLVLAGALLLQQKRHVGLIDRRTPRLPERPSGEGFNLLISKPRHLVVGVGMDSIKPHWREWGLFDNGNIPLGHMHSNLLQIALERGLPALVIWLLLLGIYARTLWQAFWKLTSKAVAAGGAKLPTGSRDGVAVSESSNRSPSLGLWLEQSEWIDRGIVLGALGGLLGFCASGLVHYNWGDSEVVMIFFFTMGLSLDVWTRANSLPGSPGP